MNTINIIIPEVYKNFDVINVSGGTLTFDALNKSFRNYQTTVSGNFQLSVLSPKPGGDYKLLITKNTAVDVIVSLPINSVLIGDPTGSTITLSGSIGEQFLIEFSYDGINLLFILGGGSVVEPGASSGFSPNVIPFINDKESYTTAPVESVFNLASPWDNNICSIQTFDELISKFNSAVVAAVGELKNPELSSGRALLMQTPLRYVLLLHPYVQ